MLLLIAMFFHEVVGQGKIAFEKTAGGLDGVIRGRFDEYAVLFFKDVDVAAGLYPVSFPDPFRDQDLPFGRDLYNSHFSTPFS
jgi:hypothetical protein